MHFDVHCPLRNLLCLESFGNTSDFTKTKTKKIDMHKALDDFWDKEKKTCTLFSAMILLMAEMEKSKGTEINLQFFHDVWYVFEVFYTRTKRCI